MTQSIFNNVFKGKRVLVTGDTGFKGSWLCVWLTVLGARVYGLSLPPKRRRDNYSRAGIAAIISHFDADINEFAAVKKVITRCKPQMIFHCAAQALVLESYKSPYSTFCTNVTGTLNVLEAARVSSGVKAIVNVTSDKCYDNQEWIHGYRETDPLGGKDPYSASKAAAEIVSAAYRHSFFSGSRSLALGTVRAGNVIGGGDWSRNRIVPDCIRALRSGKPIQLRNPHARRPWQHVLEPLCGYLLLMQRLHDEGHRWAGAWNFGPLTHNIQSVGDLARKVVEAWGHGAITTDNNHGTFHEAEMLNLDISKATNILGWHPALTFDETIAWTIDDYRNLERKNGALETMKNTIVKYSARAGIAERHRRDIS